MTAPHAHERYRSKALVSGVQDQLEACTLLLSKPEHTELHACVMNDLEFLWPHQLCGAPSLFATRGLVWARACAVELCCTGK